jgi:polysaccharide export outer membrane protein
MLNVQIWDSSENSLLTAVEDRVAELGEIRVAANGAIFVPYVGNVSVIGLTPDLAREELQTALEAIVPSAQVQLSVVEGRNNSVDLVGGVNAPGTYPMPDRNYTVLSLLAAGGGVSPTVQNPQLRLMRGSGIYGASVEELLARPQRDTLLRGGDQVFVEDDERYFLSFGASGTEALHPFTKSDLSAMDAVSIMGGIADSKADPQGLLILREYPASAIQPGQRGPRQTRVVFTLNLTRADGLFSARKFQINSGDLVMATESPINDALTISNVIGNFFGVFNATGIVN